MGAKSEKNGMETYFFIVAVRGKRRALSLSPMY